MADRTQFNLHIDIDDLAWINKAKDKFPMKVSANELIRQCVKEMRMQYGDLPETDFCFFDLLGK